MLRGKKEEQNTKRCAICPRSCGGAEIVLILCFPSSVQAFPSILESTEDMNFAGSVFPLLSFGSSKATEAALYL